MNERHDCAERKRTAAEKLWLHYYNETLFIRGIISEEERNRMSGSIEAWKTMPVDRL